MLDSIYTAATTTCLAAAAAAATGGVQAGETGECTSGSLPSRLGCILSYDGSTKDVVINYFLLCCNLSYCVAAVLCRGGPEQPHDRHQRTQPGRGQVASFRYAAAAAASLIFVVAFQIGLCLAVGCSGVSVVWCAMCGWTMSERRQRGVHRSGAGSITSNPVTPPATDDDETAHAKTRLEGIEEGVTLLDVLAIVYYAIALPFITTVAHVCALVMGAILSLISIRVSDGGEHDDVGNDVSVRLLAGPNSASGNM